MITIWVRNYSVLNLRFCLGQCTYISQSIVKSRDISSTGPSMDCNTTWSRISEPLGILIPDIDVNVHVMHIVINCPVLNIIPLIFERNTDEIPRNTADPSVFILVPMGSTKRTILESIPRTFSVMRNVTGRVAALWMKRNWKQNKKAYALLSIGGNALHPTI